MTSDIDEIWSDRNLVLLERRLWISVMEAQHRYIPDVIGVHDIRASEEAYGNVDLDRIWEREMTTKHDLKARLDEFAYLSGHSKLHLGMTSADVVENTYLIRQKHSVGTLGLKLNYDWQFRGIRGPIGSDVDQLDLLGSRGAVEEVQQRVAEGFGFLHVINAVDQCMPRSFDYALAAELVPLTHHAIDRAVANGVLTMLANQTYWLEGDVSSSCVRRYAWPLLFKVIEGSLHEGCLGCQS